MRIIALLAAYNEERFIKQSLNHLLSQGVEAYILDNCSTDGTAEIARQYLNTGVAGIEEFPREGKFSWRNILTRMEQVASTLETDWLMLSAPDEFHVTPYPNVTLAQAFMEADRQGYNAINFLEFDFIPVQESPDHDHDDFLNTMRWYYPFSPRFPHQLNAWKKQPGPVDFASRGGHFVSFPGRRMSPASLYMKHYQFLSTAHIVRKYINREFDPAAVQVGWHGWRSRLQPDWLELPQAASLLTYTSDDQLDASQPRTTHFLDDLVARYETLNAVPPPQSEILIKPASNETTIQELQNQVSRLEEQLQAVNHIADVASREVASMHNAKFYKAASLFWALRARLSSAITQSVINFKSKWH